MFEDSKVARDDTGGLMSVAQLLQACEPSLLLLAGADGRVIAADDLATGTALDVARPLAVDLADHLAENKACRFEVPSDAGPRLAFAVRLPDDAQRGILGGLVRRCKLSQERLREMQTALVVCGTLVWAAGRNKAVMMTAADGIITVDEQGVIESFNEAAGRMFGYSPREAIGRNVSMLMPSPHRERHREYLAQHLRSGSVGIVGFRREVIGRRKDRALFPLELSISEVSVGGRRGFTGIARDITKRTLLERQSVQAQKLESIGQLAAGIAHEINTPTQYINDNARFLEDAFRDLSALLVQCSRLRQLTDEDGSREKAIANVVATIQRLDIEYLLEEIPKAIGQSLEGVDHVARIVRSMKEFARHGTEQRQAVDLNGAIENTLTVSRNEWKRVAEVVTDLDANLPLVNCLPAECNQVFLSLIINAAQALSEKLGDGSSEKGIIAVTTRRDGDEVEIRIQDTGVGIPEEFRARVFDPFFTTKEVGRGTGQGLAIAHSVVTEEHGGTITFETELGRGTTFIVRLPISREPSSTPGVRSEEANPVC